jgi:hypothetical protein
MAGCPPPLRGKLRRAMPAFPPPRPRSRVGAAFTWLCPVAILAACSSSASGPHAICTLEAGGTSCHCGDGGAAPANTTPCNASSLGGDAECDVYSAPDCGCSEFACTTFNSFDGSVACGYGVPGPLTERTSPAACSGPHYCFGGTICTCRLTACDPNQRELFSCTDGAARASMKGAIAALGSTLVDDCRAATASALSSSSSGK